LHKSLVQNKPRGNDRMWGCSSQCRTSRRGTPTCVRYLFPTCRGIACSEPVFMHFSKLSKLAVVLYKRPRTSSIAARQKSPDVFLHVFHRPPIGPSRYYAYTERGNRVSNPWVRSVWIVLAIIFGKLRANHCCATSELPALTAVMSDLAPAQVPTRYAYS
jgi:hypothetical protein